MKKKIIFLSCVLFMLSSCLSFKKNIRSEDLISTPNDQRLSEYVLPLNYHATFWLNPNHDYFSGRVLINLEIKRPQAQIILHSHDLDIKAALLNGPHGQKTGSYEIGQENNILILRFGSLIEPGFYKLSLDYNARFQDDLSGLYRVKDNKEFYVFSQLEPIAARKIMPCFDEPRFKTPFEISVISPKNLKVISNNPENHVRIVGNNAIHSFAKTPPMPTYLLALAVGDFDIIKGPLVGKEHNIAFRGIATKGKGKKLAYAMKHTPTILAKLEEYFGIAYPYAKLDILAVPDFNAGAMENVGAITFREYYLLMNKKISHEQEKQFYEVMAHELAHQWFGNLVTMPWWDDLWLNEAFATWLSHHIVDELRPDFKLKQNLLARSHKAMAQDALKVARKIREPIKSSHDIYSAFDGITYSKGAALLAMLENFLGPEPMRQAISSHIKKFSNTHASSANFLESLAQFSQKKLVKSAETFLNQNGTPLINISYKCVDSKLIINASQQRYSALSPKSSDTHVWDIPLCIGYEALGEIKKHCFLLDKPEDKISISIKACPAFVMPNYEGRGYYRFAMDPENWQRLLAFQNTLSELDRISIADSMLAQLDNNSLDFGLVLNGLAGLLSTDSSMNIRYFINFLEQARAHWINEEHEKDLINFAGASLKPLYEQFHNLKNPSAEQLDLRAEIDSFLANYLQDPKARLNLSSLGSEYLAHIKKSKNKAHNLNENLVKDALSVALQDQSNERLESVIAMLAHENDVVIRKNLLFGLAKARFGLEAERIRKLVFDKNLRKNEQLALLLQQAAYAKNQPMTWNFLKSNLEEFKRTLPKAQLSRLPFLARGLCSKESALEVKKVLEPLIHDYQGGPQNLAESIEQIEICAAKRERNARLARSFFESRSKEAMIKQAY